MPAGRGGVTVHDHRTICGGIDFDSVRLYLNVARFPLIYKENLGGYLGGIPTCGQGGLQLPRLAGEKGDAIRVDWTECAFLICNFDPIDHHRIVTCHPIDFKSRARAEFNDDEIPFALVTFNVAIVELNPGEYRHEVKVGDVTPVGRVGVPRARTRVPEKVARHILWGSAAATPDRGLAVDGGKQRNGLA